MLLRLRSGARAHRSYRRQYREAYPFAEGTLHSPLLDRTNLKYFPDPKLAYVADRDGLPSWQQETDADIFERIGQGT